MNRSSALALLVCSLVWPLAACEGSAALEDGGSLDGASLDAARAPEAGSSILDASRDASATDAAMATHRSPGCEGGVALPEGSRTFTLEGRERRYVLRLPAGYSGERAWPLVLALHGNGGSATEWDRETGTQNIRAVLRDEAVLVIAEAIDGQWRDYTMPESSWPERIEAELSYFDHVIGEVSNSLCLDERALFAMGFSGGGSFSGVLACRRDDIRAIAVGGAVLYFDPADCGAHVPAAWITIGEGETNAGRLAYRDHWRAAAGCEESSGPTTPVGCIAYEGCGADTPVTFCAHPGAHVWPSFGSEAMWSFFRATLDE